MIGVGIVFVYGFCGVFVVGRNLIDFYLIIVGFGLVGYNNGVGIVY